MWWYWVPVWSLVQHCCVQPAFVPAHFQARQVAFNFFALKKKKIYGELRKAPHICALYLGQMCVHFFMKTELDSVSFLQPERGNHRIHMWLHKECP